MMIRTPAELFNLGQRNLCNFERTGDIGITGICIKGSDMNAMKCINKFMYTVYSAGVNSKTQSVEGVLSKSTFDGILPLLKEHNYWYLANNPVTLDEYARHLGTDHNKMEHITMVIPRSECTNYRLQRDNDSFYRMAVVSGSDAEQVQLKGSFYVYFLNDSGKRLLRGWRRVGGTVIRRRTAIFR